MALGDSFTEGVGDELPDGSVRGWADLVALGLALASPEPVRYANLAIRGRKLAPLIAEQLEPAIRLRPQLISINGGGNDIMRPRVSIPAIAHQLIDAVRRAGDSGIHVVLASGADPTQHLPAGHLVRGRGEHLARIVRAERPRENVTFVDNWADTALRAARYWSGDRMHLNALGHARVAANVLRALGVPVPDGWESDIVAGARLDASGRKGLGYYRDYVLPWIGRRLTGRSSGDGRTAKLAELTRVDPATFARG